MQFEDAPGDAGPEWKTERVPRIDEDSLSQLSDWSATDSEDQEQDADFSEDDFADFVNEAGWEDMGGDLTKRYNRLRQHVSASTANGSAAGEKSLPRSSGVLPAVNRPKTSNSVHSTKDHAHKSSAPIHASKVDSSLADLTHRFGAQLNLQPLHMQQNTTSTRKGGSEKVAHKDKSDRATTEQVLDPRTRLVLFKMLGRSLLSKIEGCISTGKEANVYHALSGPFEDRPLPTQLALKIYKTSILVFKDRNRYVTGEYRFKSGYSGSNPRKMVRLWAEKELRNLRRLWKVGVPCPEPIEVRNNVLVMAFLGPGEGWEASPRLKDAHIPDEAVKGYYFELLHWMRVMYQHCHLVHADLSEYNILLHKERLTIIDVSQSVEHDHPHAFDFLRSDIQNTEDFFSKRGVETIGLRRAFDFITADAESTVPSMQDSAMELTTIASQADEERHASEDKDNISGEAQQTGTTGEEEDAIFAQSWIPRRLNEVVDPERDADKVAAGQANELIYSKITGVGAGQSVEKTETKPADADAVVDEASEEEGSEESSSGSDDDSDNEEDESKPRGKKHEDKDAKKERKQAVKDAKREKRKSKMPKKHKRKQVSKTSGKR